MMQSLLYFSEISRGSTIFTRIFISIYWLDQINDINGNQLNPIGARSNLYLERIFAFKVWRCPVNPHDITFRPPWSIIFWKRSLSIIMVGPSVWTSVTDSSYCWFGHVRIVISTVCWFLIHFQCRKQSNSHNHNQKVRMSILNIFLYLDIIFLKMI